MAWELEDKLAAVGSGDEVEVKRVGDSKAPQLTLVQTLRPQVSLMDLWLGYCEFMKPQLAETTYIIQYETRYTNHVKNLEEFDFTTVEGVCGMRDKLLKTCTLYTIKRVLARLSAMTAWGMKSKRLALAVNPFPEVIVDLRVPKDKLDPDPFTLEERDIILETFKNHPVHSHYYPFIRFLFLTGCRTGEAIGLQWKHISKDCKVITLFCHFPSSTSSR
jgi:integrase